MAADPKDPPRVEDRLVTTRACLRYRECPCGKPSATGHHVLAKGSPHFGDDRIENIVPLCGSGTTGCHGLVENEDADTLRMLGVHLVTERPDVVAYVLAKLGQTAGADYLRRRLFVEV